MEALTGVRCALPSLPGSPRISSDAHPMPAGDLPDGVAASRHGTRRSRVPASRYASASAPDIDRGSRVGPAPRPASPGPYFESRRVFPLCRLRREPGRSGPYTTSAASVAVGTVTTALAADAHGQACLMGREQLLERSRSFAWRSKTFSGGGAFWRPGVDPSCRSASVPISHEASKQLEHDIHGMRGSCAPRPHFEQASP